MNKYKVLQDNLNRDERLIWSQAPAPMASFRGRSILTFIWGIIWTGLVISMFSFPTKTAGPPEVFRVVFIGFGVFFTLSSFRDVLVAALSIYGITDNRLLIVTEYPWKSVVQSLYANDIEFIKKETRSDGSGNLIFKTIRVRYGRGYADKDVGFFGIRDVNSVESLVINQFRADRLASESRR